MLHSNPRFPIGSMVDPLQKWDPSKNGLDERFTYIDIAAVGRISKRIEETAELLCHEAPSRARQLVCANDVLVSTVRPNLNAVALVGDDNDGATASTGFTMLRPKAGIIDARYLYYWVRTPYFIQDLVRQATGASYPAVSDGIIKTTKIPLPTKPDGTPDIDEQRRIAAILDKADTIRRQRQETIRLSEEFLRSAFLEMFGDPVTNPKGWEVVELGKLCQRVVDCAHTTPTYSEDVRPYPCVRSSDIQAWHFDWSSTKTVSQRIYETRTKRHIPISGDVVFCREGARFGNAARIPEGYKICLGQRMMIFQALKGTATAEYLWALLNLSQEAFAGIAGGAAAPRVNIKDLVGLKVMRPPIDVQRHFSDLVGFIDRIKEHNRQLHEENENLFNSLVQRAFCGEL